MKKALGPLRRFHTIPRRRGSRAGDRRTADEAAWTHADSPKARTQSGFDIQHSPASRNVHWIFALPVGYHYVWVFGIGAVDFLTGREAETCV